MQVSSIYATIQEDLSKVEENLRSLTRTDLIPTPDLLAHTFNSQGKRIRPALTLLSGKFYNYDLKLLLPMATAVELLHIATLVHDDTIDGSSVRRSKATVNSLWGKEIALILGDYLFAMSADLTSTTENVAVMRLFARTLMTISAGELRQNLSAYNALDREQYFQRIESKTASLFSMACETGAILSRAPEKTCLALKDYGNHLGMAFQIVDDILDFVGDETKLGKPVGSDLMQGTVTLPAIIFIETYPQDTSFREALQSKGNREKVKRAVEALSNSTVIKKTYDVAMEYCLRAREDLKDVPAGPTRDPLEALTTYIVERNR